jgi:hypothetical protein
MNLHTDWLLAAGLGGPLALVTLLCSLLLLRARRLQARLQQIEGQFQTLRAEVAAATGLSARVGERLRRIDQASSQMGERLGQLELRGEGRPYDQAITLAGRGADSDRLVAHFGLSRGEADLLTLVHGRRQAG